MTTASASDLTDLFDALSFWLFWLPMGLIVLGMVAAMLVVASPLIAALWLAGRVRNAVDRSQRVA